jgi:hypothetical protein
MIVLDEMGAQPAYLEVEEEHLREQEALGQMGSPGYGPVNLAQVRDESCFAIVAPRLS